MPKIQRSDVSPALLEHLLDRMYSRAITLADLMQLVHWLDGNPTVPTGDWFKRFYRVTVCGSGPLIKTFLTSQQSARGEEVRVGMRLKSPA